MAMADYLTPKHADYITQSLNIPPQKVLQDTADKMQRTVESDNGTMQVASFSNDSFFTVTMMWEFLTMEQVAYIQSLWHSPSKANGRERTLYWVHPSDTYTYVIRFLEPLVRTQTGNIYNYRSIESLSVRVEGVKP